MHTGMSCEDEGRDQGNVDKPRNTKGHQKTIRNYVRGREQMLSHIPLKEPALQTP